MLCFQKKYFYSAVRKQNKKLTIEKHGVLRAKVQGFEECDNRL